MSLITFADITKDLGGKKVLDGVAAEIHDGDRIGLIGRNGCGKTTLLRAVTGELVPDTGAIHRKKDMRVGYLPQQPIVRTGVTTWEEALEPFAHLVKIEKELDEIGDAMGSADESALAELVDRQAALQERFTSEGGYTYKPRVRAALTGLGLREEHIDRPVERLSGGEKNRLGLAKLLLQEPELLVLDEPTNYLDIHAVGWLEEFLRGYKNAFLVVSHDRYFLDRTVRKIWEHRGGKVDVYRGNYKEYRRQRDERDERQQKEYEQQQREIAKQKEFIRKNIAGQKTKQAQGRRKQLERMERIEAPGDDGADAKIRFGMADRGGNDVLMVKDLSKTYGDRTLFSGLDVEIFRGDRIGIIGPNGTGKSTLLRIIHDEERPETGQVKLGSGVVVGYYDQEHRDLNRANTLFQDIREVVPQWTDLEVRNYLAAFLFREDEAFKVIGDASGGERARVALARIALRGSNFLVLDEPTNHLDLSSRRVLEEALLEYPGTILVVSHDRYLLDRICEKLLVFEGGEVRLFNGNYSLYAETLRAEEEAVRKAEEERKQRDREAAKKATAAAREAEAGKKKAAKKRKFSYEELETRIIEAEERIQKAHDDMASEDAYKDPDRMKELTAELEAAKAELAELEEEWASWE